ncbi:alpha/beta hydrolase [Olivibacter sp. CPCC 100613]|uniref:alpha/beta fold hydrolase n=1 Tax=Olivibacter sp. CPCC 100613 TaxID=3079931 RepID=UPI002FFA3C74
MKSIRKINILCSLLLLVPVWSLGANQTKKVDVEFYIPVKDSRLYVRVVGNPQAPLLINLHGGPGGFSGFDHLLNEKHLEDDYLVAYLDQRGGGKSDACPDSTLLTMQQFVADLDVVVDTLKNKYHHKQISLVGSSWGGSLGLLYMIDHQDKITSFVCVSGKADGVYPVYALIEHEEKLASDLLQETKDEKKRERYKEILSTLNEVKGSDFNRFYEKLMLIKMQFPKELGFSPYWSNTKAQALAVQLGKDPAYYAAAHYTKASFDEALEKGEYVNRIFRNTRAYNYLNILPALKVINKPVLVVQGEDDYAIGQKQGSMIYSALTGVPAEKKELHMIPHAAHNLNMESEELYYKIIKTFLWKHLVP